VFDDAGGSGFGRWSGGWLPSDESSSVDRGVGVDAVAELVDGDVMVIPAEGDEV